MQLQQMFDARSVEPSQVFQPLPPGEYKVLITESEPKATSAGDGGYLQLTLKVMEGQYMGRELKWNLNLFNKSQQAVEIAYRQLSAICHVTGVFQIQASEQLHGIPFVAVVAIQANNPQYNDIKGVKDLAGNTPGKGGNTGVASAQPPAFPATPQPAAAAPWAAPAAAAPPPTPAPWAPPQAAPAAAPAWQPPQAPAAPAPTAAPPAAPPWSPAAPAAAPPWAAQPPAAPSAPPTWQPPSK